MLLSRVYVGAPGAAVALGVFTASSLIYFAYRWRSLRAEVAQGTFRADEFHKNPQKYILGSGRSLWLWFAGTMAAVLATIIYAAIVGKPV